MKLRVVHYINQFYGGIGGEEMADYKPEVRLEPIGPGLALKGALGEDAEIVATIICGDSYFNENLETAKAEVLQMVKDHNPDLFIAGPAFNAGRYGVAAGTITEAVQEELGIPAVTAMYIENPGADMFKKSVYIVETKNSAAGMRDAVSKLAPLALKLARKEEIGSPAEEHYLERGIRKNIFRDKVGGERAVDMMLKKLKGEPFETEYPMPSFDRVPPNKAVLDLSKATIALATSGGTVPFGNPDHVESSSASKFGAYDITGIDDLKPGEWETAHGGYDPIYANEEPDRVLPVDVLRKMEKEGRIGKLYNTFFSTVGNGTAVKSSKAFAEEYATQMVKDGVDAVIMTSTWGTCTRCGATMVKEIERAGLPVVHICTVTPISMTVGANRIVPAVAIPHPLGNPAMEADEEFKVRERIVERALQALETEVEEQTIFEV